MDIACPETQGNAHPEDSRRVQADDAAVSQRQPYGEPGHNRADHEPEQKHRGQEANDAESLGVFREQAHPTPPVAHHLTEHARKRRSRMVTNANRWREKTAATRPMHAMIEFTILTRVEFLIEQSDAL